VKEDEFDDLVMALNMGHKSWTLNDIIYNYSMRGEDSFSKFIEFCQLTDTLHDAKDINPRYGAAALGIPTTHLKKRSLGITDEQFKEGAECVREAKEIRMKFCDDLKANGGGWYEPFLRAWSEVRLKLIEKGIPFKTYLREFDRSLRTRKKVFAVPFGSNKRSEWSTCLTSVFAYV